MEPMAILEQKNERRCAACGARTFRKTCHECGATVAPRAEIGVLAGVNNNFGTVNNVYNMSGGQAPDPEIVDLRDIQDGLNQRFPERVPGPPNLPTLTPSPMLPSGPSQKTVRTVNTIALILGVVMATSVVGVTIAFLWL